MQISFHDHLQLSDLFEYTCQYPSNVQNRFPLYDLQMTTLEAEEDGVHVLCMTRRRSTASPWIKGMIHLGYTPGAGDVEDPWINRVLKIVSKDSRHGARLVCSSNPTDCSNTWQFQGSKSVISESHVTPDCRGALACSCPAELGASVCTCMARIGEDAISTRGPARCHPHVSWLITEESTGLKRHEMQFAGGFESL
jgi:hypothetical protein